MTAVLLDCMDEFLTEILTLGDRHPLLRPVGPRDKISKLRRAMVFERDGNACCFCGYSGLFLEVDHIVPWASFGCDCPENLRTLCQWCNATRSNHPSLGDRLSLPITRGCDQCTGRASADLPRRLAFCIECETTSPAVADAVIACAPCRRLQNPREASA